MDLLKNIDQIKTFDECVFQRVTGTPSEFSSKLGISESSLYRFIKGLKQQYRIPIKYCRIRKTYYYDKPQLSIFYALQIISRRSLSYENRKVKDVLVQATEVSIL